jgi:hypothetical protein
VPVPDNATALDQLIAFTGRNPAMTSPNTIKRVIDVDGAVLHADTRWGATPALVFLHYCTTGEVRGAPGGQCSLACNPIRLS